MTNVVLPKYFSTDKMEALSHAWRPTELIELK